MNDVECGGVGRSAPSAKDTQVHEGDDLPVVAWRRIDRQCLAFEDAWQSGAAPPAVEQFLSEASEPERAALLRELLLIDVAYRRARGQEPKVEEYEVRFPAYRSVIDEVLRSGATRAVRLREADGFASGGVRIRCPHCHNPVEIVGCVPAAPITCPSCGSAFHVAPEGTVASQLGAAAGSAVPRRIAHFELSEPLGQGAFGTVWKARDTKLDRLVAIKVPRRGGFDSKEEERFLREARAPAELHHPNIVDVYEVGHVDGVVYLASELIEGQPLDKWVETQGQRLTEREAAQICVTIAEALQYAHEHGVIHRDLKPSNIMMDASGQPHLMDFGLAKREATEITMTVEGQILGTPAYMSPEQAGGAGHLADGRTDVYSLGVILFELLTGERPFRGETRMLLKQVLDDEPPSVRTLNSRVSRDLETVCAKCLEKPPGRRYACAAALADDLRHYLAGEPIHARRVSRPERLWRWCKRQPVVATLVAAIGLSLLLGTVVSTYFAVRATTEAGRARDNAKRADAKTAEARAAATRADERAAEARANLYASEMNMAQMNWEATSVVPVLDLLRRWEPNHGERDLRGWEWYYQWRLCHSDLRTLELHTDCVLAVAFSPDGQLLASVSMMDKTVKLRDAGTGQQLRALRGHIGSVRSLAFSPDGHLLASASHDGTVKLWDMATGHEARTLRGHTGAVTSVAFRPDARRLASASHDGSVKLWDTATGRELGTLKGHTAGILAVAFSPDGRRLGSGSMDMTVKLWDAATGQDLRTLKGHGGRVFDVAFSPDGRRLGSGGDDRTVKFWDAATGRELRTLKGHTQGILALAFSPDGQLLASSDFDATVKLWEAATGQELRTLKGHVGRVFDVTFSPDGQRLASAGDEAIKLWETRRGEGPRGLMGATASVAFSPDGQQLASASGGGTMKLWDVTTGRQVRTRTGLRRPKELAPAFLAGDVAFSPEGQRLAFIRDAGTVLLWDIATGQEVRTLKGHMDCVTAVAFSPDGQWLASACLDTTLKLWDVATGQDLRTLKGHVGQVRDVAFSPDGQQLISASFDRTVKFWDAASGRELRTLKGHTDRVITVAFSPDGLRLASGSSDTTVKLWDTATGQDLYTLKGHKEVIGAVAFSSDGRRMASGSADGTVKLWDTATGQQLRSLEGHVGSVNTVAFSPDGHYLAWGGPSQAMLADARPLTDELRMDREAQGLVEFLCKEVASEDSLVARIRETNTVTRVIRQKALAMAPSCWSRVVRDQALAKIAAWPQADLTDKDLDLLQHVPETTELRLSGTQVTDAGLAKLATLPNLQNLMLGDLALTGEGFQHLRGLRVLRELILDRDQHLSPDSFAHLASLTQLDTLGLADAPVGDAALSHLRRLRQLRHLDLARTQVTDASLDWVAEQEQLYYLCLSGTRVSDAGLQRLTGLRWLAGLLLGQTSITDSGLAHVSSFTKLVALDVEDTPVTNAGLRHLYPLKKLQQLNLRGTKVTGAGVVQLRNFLHNCRVDFGG